MNAHRGSAASGALTAVLALVVALALAACGDSNNTTTAPSTTAPPSTSLSATTSLPVETTSRTIPLPTPTVAGAIAFSKINRDRASWGGEIYAAHGDGWGLTRLAADETESLESPAWSRDAKRIAFHSGTPEAGVTTFTVWVMNADGSDKQKLTTGSERGLWPAWSPDGKQIVFSRVLDGETFEISVMNADGSGLKGLTNESPDIFPSWAPNGKIYFLRSDEADVYSVNAGGSGLTRVTESGNVNMFALSSDGKRLVIHDGVADRLVLLTVDGQSTPVVLLDSVSQYVKDKCAVAWSPDGTALAFAASDNGDQNGSPLYIINADGSGLSVVPNTGAVWDPAWRPE